MTTEAGIDADSQLIAAVADKIHNDGEFAAGLLEAVGSFADIEASPWAELTAGQQAVRKELALSDRTGVRLGTVQEVYDALSGAGRMSGKYLKLGGPRQRVTVIGLDDTRRRWLRMRPTAEAAAAAAAANDVKTVRSVLSRAGSVTASWSMYRSEYVPSPETVLKYLPVPEGGCLLCIVSGTPGMLAKDKFLAASRRLIAGSPVSDLLFWDKTVLWTVRGGFGLSEDSEDDFDEPVRDIAAELQESLGVS